MTMKRYMSDAECWDETFDTYKMMKLNAAMKKMMKNKAAMKCGPPPRREIPAIHQNSSAMKVVQKKAAMKVMKKKAAMKVVKKKGGKLMKSMTYPSHIPSGEPPFCIICHRRGLPACVPACCQQDDNTCICFACLNRCKIPARNLDIRGYMLYSPLKVMKKKAAMKVMKKKATMKVSKRKAAMKVMKHKFDKAMWKWVDEQCKAMGPDFSNLCPFDQGMYVQTLTEQWDDMQP